MTRILAALLPSPTPSALYNYIVPLCGLSVAIISPLILLIMIFSAVNLSRLLEFPHSNLKPWTLVCAQGQRPTVKCLA